jgi:hypothetical protein
LETAKLQLRLAALQKALPGFSTILASLLSAEEPREAGARVSDSGAVLRLCRLEGLVVLKHLVHRPPRFVI